MASNPVAEWMRRELWAHYARVFPSNGKLLDLAAGTGADALWLAQRGASIMAIDVSPGMLSQLQRRATSLNVDTRVLSLEQLDQLEPDQFDGALSAFAGLNTVEDLPGFARGLARVLKPGSHVILHALNSFCLWETVNHVLHGRRPRPRQRVTEIGGIAIQHRFLDPDRLYREVFSKDFRLRDRYALSVITAPTWIRRTPRAVVPWVFKVDRVAGRYLRGAGDFFVMDLIAQ